MATNFQDLKTVVEQFEYIDWHGEAAGFINKRAFLRGLETPTLMVEMREDGFDLPKWDRITWSRLHRRMAA